MFNDETSLRTPDAFSVRVWSITTTFAMVLRLLVKVDEEEYKNVVKRLQ
jgi:preprotein translocase subunit Sss1